MQTISIPNKIFYLLIAPLILFKPKLFEEIFRMQSDLSGSQKVLIIQEIKKISSKTF